MAAGRRPARPRPRRPRPRRRRRRPRRPHDRGARRRRAPPAGRLPGYPPSPRSRLRLAPRLTRPCVRGLCRGYRKL